MKHIFYLPALVILMVTAFSCYAEVSEYDIEIVIFEDTSQRYVDSEQWPRLEHHLLTDKPETSVIIGNNLNQEKTGSEENAVINIASSDTSMLNEYTKTINASSRYNVLVHKAWRQAGLDAEAAINIPVNSNDSSEDNNLLSPTDINTRLNAKTGKTSSSITGEIKIILGRYLHIHTDLIYKRPNTSYSPVLTSSPDQQLKEYSIKSHRRMRSKELHYIDHPLVGILVMALPVEQEDVQAEGQPTQ
jgi:hypothetical protein